MKGFGDLYINKKKINKKTKNSKEQIINQAIQFHLKGNISEATKYYQQLISEGCNHHIVFSNYGLILQNLGKLQDAEKSYRKAIEINPDYANAHCNLGNVLRDLGKLQDAEKSYRKAIEINPAFANAHCNLGNALRDLGKLQDAEKSYRKAIEINPAFADAHYNLGNVLRDLDKFQDAEKSYRKAIEINPAFADAHSNLGNVLRDLGKLQDAEFYTRKAIEINPDYANAHSNLGVILKDLDKLQDAEFYTRKAIEINPAFADAHSNLGIILKDLGKLQDAEFYTRKAIEINPDYANAHSNLGVILKDLGKLQDAEFYTRKAIEINPDFTDAYFTLFRLYENINNLEKLKEALNEFKKIDSIKNELLLFNSRLSFRNKEHQTAKELIDNISAKWIENSNSSKQSLFWSYKAFIEDKIGNYDIAYSCFEKSQKDPIYQRFRKDSFLKEIDSYKNSITNKGITFNTLDDAMEDYNLAFLIGFPRSGTTLLDTILRSHQDIEVLEEKPLIYTIQKLVEEKFNTKLDNLYSLSRDNIVFLRKNYDGLIKTYKNNEASLIIDKLPLNTISLPLINHLFPSAKIIFTHRHPYDTVLSCFQQSFKPNEAMANLVSLKSSSIMYDQVMNAWDLYKNNLSLDFITSKYEHLIEDFDDHTSKILEFLGVGWDENVRNYRKTALERGKINTPSSSQVVQPLYKSSIAKWKNYEKYFEDCHQYLEKWVSYFEY